MKKTVFLLTAALSAFFAFGQTAVTESMRIQSKMTDNPVQLQAMRASKNDFTKADPIDIIKSYSFSKADRNLLKFGTLAPTKPGDVLIDGVYGNWFWASSAKDSNTFKVAETWNQSTENWDIVNRRWGRAVFSDPAFYNSTTPTEGILFISPSDNTGDPDLQKVGAYHSWVQFPTIDATGLDVVTIEFWELTVRGNEQRYIDYSIDGIQWDTIVINTRYAWSSFGEMSQGNRSFTIPKRMTDVDSIYIRFRYQQDALTDIRYNPGYPWLIDDVVIRKGKDIEVNILQAYSYEFYPFIPKGVQTGPTNWSVAFNNVGVNPLSNIFGEITYTSPNHSYTFKTEEIGSTPFCKDTLVVAGYDRSTIPSTPTTDTATYKTSGKLFFNNGQELIVGNPLAMNINSGKTDPNCVDVENNILPFGIWARDNGGTIYKNPWTMSVKDNVLSYDPEVVIRPEYGILTRYITDTVVLSEKKYFIGVQVVLDNIYSKVGAMAMPVIYSFKRAQGNDYDQEYSFDGKPSFVEQKHITNFTAGLLFKEENTTKFNMFFEDNYELLEDRIYFIGYKLPNQSDFVVMQSTSAPHLDFYGQTALVSNSSSIRLIQSGNILNFVSPTEYPMVRAIVADNPRKVGISSPKEIEFHLSAFPNPATNYVTISYNVKESTNTTIEIRNITGKLVKTVHSKSVANNVTTENINITDLKTGTYIFTLNVNGLKQTKKFVVSK